MHNIKHPTWRQLTQAPCPYESCSNFRLNHMDRTSPLSERNISRLWGSTKTSGASDFSSWESSAIPLITSMHLEIVYLSSFFKCRLCEISAILSSLGLFTRCHGCAFSGDSCQYIWPFIISALTSGFAWWNEDSLENGDWWKGERAAIV